MEVCGGQTHGLLRHGIDEQLAHAVSLIHGPGCPVCVTPVEEIDHAISLAARPDVILASFGDMLRVPGSQESLLQARTRGGDVRLVYSPLDAVALALRMPARQVVFFAVGFETTTPATALAVQQAAALGLDNFSLLVAHVRVLPAMEAIMQDEACRVEGFLAAGHVCTVDGFECYEAFATRYGVPVVVAGFEPVDLLTGILDCVRLIESGAVAVVNSYERSVRSQGNEHARRIVSDVYEACDRPWRGLGVIRHGGLKLREPWRRFDAAVRFPRAELPISSSSRCRSGEVLTGRIRPTDCECFGRECTPELPLGAPMVSSEGACAAYYRYARRSVPDADSVAVPAR
jgi:hydrogenase expression/formation protein HypD